MIKELRNLLYILTIFFFFFYIGKYYFSDNYKKKSYRTINNLKKNFNAEDTNLITLKSDTEDIVEHVINASKKKRKYNFWKLLKNN
ncbi:hypothetical protein OAH88_02120 [Candidatus Pelagibacter sp.]|nr:hypothetical protein [Candidatus Pelagibacter sp.]